MNNLHSINTQQGLYVLSAGHGYSCLGFEVAQRKIEAVSAWLNEPLQFYPLGTEEHYAEYMRVMALGFEKHRVTGKRCDADLCKPLVGLEGKRVEVITPGGEHNLYYVGKSTGWMPCHLEIKTKRSLGGCAAYVPEGSTVRLVA